MGYKDTVMNEQQMQKAIIDDTDVSMGKAIAKGQAEISFKAGQEQATEDNYYRGYALGKRAGIREVVEWIEKHGNIEASMTGSWFVMPDDSWQAFKKEVL